MKPDDLTPGTTIGARVVLAEVPPRGHREGRRLRVRCACGWESVVYARELRAGRSGRCGSCRNALRDRDQAGRFRS